MNDAPTKKRWGLRLFLLLLAFVLILLLALPAILSSAAVRSRVVDAVNASGSLSLQVEDWSLAWVGAQQVAGLTLQTRDGLSVQVPNLRINQGLLGLLLTRDAGIVTIDQPRIVIPAPTSSSPVDAGRISVASAPNPAKPADTATPPASPGIKHIPVTGTVKIQNGTLALSSPSTGNTAVLEKMTATAELPASGEKLILDFTADAPAGGHLVLQGQADLTGLKSVDLKNLPVQAQLKLNQLQLEPYLAWASSMKGVPRGEGVLELQLQTDGSMDQGFTLVGKLTGTGIQLAGGALGKDEPSFDNITVDLDGRFTPDGLQFRKLDIQSPVLTVNATGQVDESGAGNFAIQSTTHLAEVFARFPHTLKLREGMEISEGQLSVRGTIRTTAEQQHIEGAVNLVGLQGMLNGQAVALSEPVEAVIKGEKGPRGIRVEQLDIKSNFMRGSGSGTPEDFRLTLDANLPAALAEVDKFVDLAPWSAAGQAALAITIKDKGGDRRDLTGNLELKGFLLRKGSEVLVPEQLLQIDLRAESDQPEGRFLTRIHQGQVLIQSGFGNGRIALSNLVLPEDNGIPAIETVKLGAQIHLGKLSPLLPSKTSSPPKLQGKAVVSGDLALAKERLSFKALEINLDGFAAEDAGQKITWPAIINASGSFSLDPENRELSLDKITVQSDTLSVETEDRQTILHELSLSSSGKLNLARRSAAMGPSSVACRAFTLRTGNLDLPDWKVPTDVRGSVNLAATLEDLWKMGQPTGSTNTPPIQGRLQADVDLSGLQEAGLTATVNGTIEELVYAARDQETIREKQVTLSGKIVLDEKSKNLGFTELALQSTPLTLSAQGHFNQYDTVKNLEARGNLAVDLEQLAPYLKPVVDPDLVMKGRTDKPFEVVLSLGAGTPAETARGYASLHADELSLFGLTFLDLELPMSISNNVAQLSLTATANKGKVEVRPGIDFGSEVRSLTIPEDSLVLNEVQLTGRLADALLGRIHPLFKGASVVGGRVSMTMENFDMPLGPDKQNDMKFAGILHLKDVKLGASGMLEGLLNAIKVKEQSLDLGDRDIRFKCENGRITTSATRIKVEGYEIILEGSVGLDQSLQYAAKVPVTKELVGKDAYEYVKGTELSLPIGGTVSRPRLDDRAFRSAINQLIKDATRKAIQNKGVELLEGLLK